MDWKGFWSRKRSESANNKLTIDRSKRKAVLDHCSQAERPLSHTDLLAMGYSHKHATEVLSKNPSSIADAITLPPNIAYATATIHRPMHGEPLDAAPASAPLATTVSLPACRLTRVTSAGAGKNKLGRHAWKKAQGKEHK